MVVWDSHCGVSYPLAGDARRPRVRTSELACQVLFCPSSVNLISRALYELMLGDLLVWREEAGGAWRACAFRVAAKSSHNH